MHRNRKAMSPGPSHRRRNLARQNSAGDMNSSKAVSQSPTPGTWASIKARLQSVERIGLVDLIHVLYESDPEIQQGLVMRFAPSEKCITPARKRIVDLVYPDPLGSLPIQADEAVEVIKKFHKISRDPISTCAMRRNRGRDGSSRRPRDRG